MVDRTYYTPSATTIEAMPNSLQMFFSSPLVMLKPHWHAQVEVNFVIEGALEYQMGRRELRLEPGDLCLFWGGQPHRLHTISPGALFAGGHLPLVHFFRLRLPKGLPARLMQGAVLLLRGAGAGDRENFARWNSYVRSGDPVMAEHAVSELLLRLERVRFEPYDLIDGGADAAIEPADQQTARSVARICDFIAEHFLEEMDSLDIAAAAGLHPKYAMTVFRKATGMTMNEYLTLLRLSYAQARLLEGNANVLDVAMDSGFGSLSAFNKAFRKIAGITPRDFRRKGGPADAELEPARRA